jgi:signal transduction histidine kinase
MRGVHRGVERHLPEHLNPQIDDTPGAWPYPASMNQVRPLPSTLGEADPLVARWLRPLAVATFAAVLVLSLLGSPAPSLHGDGLAVSIALALFAASFLALLSRHCRPWAELLALVAIIAASGTLIWTQRNGGGVAALFLVSGYAATRLPTPRSLAIFTLAVVTFAVAASHGERSVAVIAAGELGLVAFYVLAAFTRRVREAHEQTKQLLAELEATRRTQAEAATLRERSRVAREIHDVLAHSLSGLMLQLEGARMLANQPSANGKLLATLDRAHHLAQAGLEEARRAIGALRDDQLPGTERLRALAADFTRDSRVEATLEVSGTVRALGSETSLTIFRVAQEALTNARRHARPERVELRLGYEAEGTRLVVEDHGEAALAATRAEPGANRPGAGYGLTGMRERAELLGGTLDAGPTPDGFRVELWIPT